MGRLSLQRSELLPRDFLYKSHHIALCLMQPHSVAQQTDGSIAITWPSLSKVSLKQLWPTVRAIQPCFWFPLKYESWECLECPGME